MGKSVYKQVKEDGKASLPESKVKQRKNFAPKTKPFKSKGSGKGTDPKKRDKKVSEEEDSEDFTSKNGNTFKESTDIAKFIDSILAKNYSEADKYIKQAVESKLQSKIEKELTKTLF